MPQGTIAYTRVEMTQMVLPQFTNPIGTVFGGQILSWIDICAAVSAQRYSKSPVVTASIDSVHFLEPIKQGYVVILKSQVNAVFASSMEVGVVVIAEAPLTGKRKKAARAYCTFVALDPQSGHPFKLPPLIIKGKAENRRNKDAHERRRVRLLSRNLATPYQPLESKNTPDI